jgi:hypothetical protein
MMRFTPQTNLMLNRLLWKETRELAPLWAGVLGIGLLVLLLAMQIGLTGAAHGAAAVALAGCFGLAAVARQFAGEDEDGTIAWLRMLPCDGWSVWWAKLITAYAGSLLLWLTLAGMAFITARQVPSTMIWEIPATANVALATFLVTGPAIGMAVSLESRNVLTTVLGTAGISLVVSWIAGLLPDSLLYGPYQFVIAATSLGGARRLFDTWWQGPAAPVFEELLPERVRVETRTGTVPRLQARLWAWSEQSATRRMWRSLLWQELRGAGTFLFWWLLIVPAAMGGLKFVAAELRPAWWLILATPLLAGIWSLRRDQRFGAVAFFGDRGISALVVWLSRQIVWLPLAVILGGTAMLLDATAFGLFNNWNLLNVEVPSAWEMSEKVGELYQSPAHWLRCKELELGFVLLSLYAVGHLAGLVFSPLVMALVMGSIVGGAAMLWQGWRIADFNTPSLLGLLFPVGVLAIAAGLAGPWMERRLGIKRILASMCLLVVGWIGLSYAVALSGLWAIPAASERAYVDLEAAKQRLLNPDTEATREIVAAVENLQAGLHGGGDQWDEEFVQVMTKHLANKPTPQLDYRLLKGGGLDGLGLIIPEAERSIREMAEKAGPVSAAEFLLAYERLGRVVRENRDMRLDWFTTPSGRNDRLLEAWMAWAVRDDVPPQAIATMIVALEDELILSGKPSSANALSLAWYLVGDGTPNERRLRESLERIVGISTQFAPKGINRWRLERALAAGYDRGRDREPEADSATRELRRAIPNHLRSRFTALERFHGDWRFQDSPLRNELRRYDWFLGWSAELYDGSSAPGAWAIVQWNNDRRLLLTAMAVEWVRKSTSRLPDRFDTVELPATDDRPSRKLPVDLFTGQPFGYAPHGFEGPALAGIDRYVPGQPLLWMAGPDGNHWAPVEDEEKSMRFQPDDAVLGAFYFGHSERRQQPFSPWARPIFRASP